jgi:hypothetical protein
VGDEWGGGERGDEEAVRGVGGGGRVRLILIPLMRD